MNMKTAFWTAASALLLFGCGGSEPGLVHLPYDSMVQLTVTRADHHPTYQCDGTIDTRTSTAEFTCTAEGFKQWTIVGPVEEFQLSTVVRLWIRASGVQRITAQPDIATDLEPKADRLIGWATVILPDGTESGHAGAVAEAFGAKR